MKRILVLTLAIIGITSSAMAENMSTNKDNVISSLRGRIVSPSVGNFSFFFDQEIRSTDNFGSFKDSRSSVFSVYAPLDWLKLSAGYVFMIKEGSDSPQIKNRFIFAAEGGLDIGRFGFVLRERLESTAPNGYLFASLDDPTKRVNLLRTRLKINYDTNGKVTPYIYTELYNHTNRDMLLSRVRSQAGVEWAVCSNAKVTAFYQYAHFCNDPTSTAPHTLGVLYTYKFSGKK